MDEKATFGTLTNRRGHNNVVNRDEGLSPN